MKTILNEVSTNTLEIKRSKFITVLGKVTNKEELQAFLDRYMRLDATHNCYAYKFGIQQISGGYKDDGEPTGSAGLPIFKVIENNDLTNIVILVIRYFGGVKLGQGPLTRAYGKSASEALKLATVVEIKTYWQTKLRFPLKNIKKVERWCAQHDCEILTKEFDQLVEYLVQSTDQIQGQTLFEIVDQTTVSY